MENLNSWKIFLLGLLTVQHILLTFFIKTSQFVPKFLTMKIMAVSCLVALIKLKLLMQKRKTKLFAQEIMMQFKCRKMHDVLKWQDKTEKEEEEEFYFSSE